LKDLRLALDMTQSEFSQYTGIPYPRLTKIEQRSQHERLFPKEVVSVMDAAIAAGKDPIQFFRDWASAESAQAM
jgi:transcriptional regulator with XRE-family HTH domain